MRKKLAIIDGDYIVYRAAFVGEERTIVASYKDDEGKLIEMPFKNKTALWGRYKRGEGGWLKEYNDDREQKGLSLLTPDEITVEEVIQQKEDVRTILHTAKCMVKSAVESVGAKDYVCYIGGKQPLYRLENSTLLEYKGNRKNLTPPILRGVVRDYILGHQNGHLVTDGHEADDYCVMRYYEEVGKGGDAEVVTPDKDIRGCSVKYYDPLKKEHGSGRGFGKLYIDGKRVRGYGRLWFYFQWIYADTTDNYRANCVSDKRWGEISAYNALKDCRNDQEAMEAAMCVYKMLYPEPIEVVGWRGDTIAVDYEYVANEVWDMARMRRWDGDEVTASDVWRKFGLL